MFGHGRRERLGAGAWLLAEAWLLAIVACKTPPHATPAHSEAKAESTSASVPVSAVSAVSSAPLAPTSQRGSGPDATASAAAAEAPSAPRKDALPNELLCMTTYYDAAQVEGTPGTYSLLVKPAGERIAYEVRPPYRVQNPLRDFVVKDLFDPAYPRGPIAPITDSTFDPGRIRIESLLRSTYGYGRNEVEAKLVTVSLGGHFIRVHERIREAMKRVDTRVQELFKSDGQLRKYFDHMGGTYNYRNIAGTEQLSTHAFGIAIDLSTYFSHYWRNAADATPQWKNSIPEKLVLAFEAEGFIWGGRWYHYDTMHFEYRPELLDERCRGR